MDRGVSALVVGDARIVVVGPERVVAEVGLIVHDPAPGASVLTPSSSRNSEMLCGRCSGRTLNPRSTARRNSSE
jgi:hypothetical protein